MWYKEELKYFDMHFNISPNSKISQNSSIKITFPLELPLSRVVGTSYRFVPYCMFKAISIQCAKK